MRITSLFAITSYLLIANFSYAQDCCATLRAQINLFPDQQSIRDLGSRGSAKDLEFLRALSGRTNLGPLRSDIRAALARLGDDVSFLDLLPDVYNKNGSAQAQAFNDLRYIGGDRSLLVLNDRLTDVAEPIPDGDAILPSPAIRAVWVLSKLVPNGPANVETGDWDGANRALSGWSAYLAAHLQTAHVSEKLNWHKALEEAVSAQNERAIIGAGYISERQLLPAIRLLAGQVGSEPRIERALQMLSARLGDKEAWQRIVTRTTDFDPRIQDDAVDQVVYVGGDRAIRVLTRMLETLPIPITDHEINSVVSASSEGLVVPLGVKVMQSLAYLTPGFPVWATAQNAPQALITWRSWLKSRGPR